MLHLSESAGERDRRIILALVEGGETLINCLAYVDLNPVRAGIVRRPDDYRWNSLGYHQQTGNKDCFLSLDFGLIDCVKLTKKQRLTRYRQFIYEVSKKIHP